jgi:hypothetical protein
MESGKNIVTSCSIFCSTLHRFCYFILLNRELLSANTRERVSVGIIWTSLGWRGQLYTRENGEWSCVGDRWFYRQIPFWEGMVGGGGGG